MAYGVKPPKLGDYAFNLAESADYMFDHAIFNDCMANVDFCEQMVKETNPSVLAKAEQTPAEHSSIHGYRTIADIMRALNPFTGEFYLETLHVARYTREMYCLFGGRHTHPSTIMPGGCSANITHQTMTDYYVRLMRYFEYVKRTVPMHDDLYDFFYEALPGYEKVGYRDTNLVCWGAFDDPDIVDYDYRTMTDWGRRRFITPGIAINGELVTTDLVEINGMIRILLGSSYFDSWENERTWVTEDPLGNPIDKDHPWNKTTIPKPQARDFTDKYSWVTSPRIYDKRTDTYVCCDTGGGPFARQWVTAKAGLVDLGFLKATGESILMTLPKTASMPEMELEWKVPQWSNAIERDRARSYHQAYSALVGLYNLEKALVEVRAGRTKSWTNFTVPEEAISVGFHEAARGVISHHMVIRDGKIANYQPYPPTPWNAVRVTSTALRAPTRTRCRTRRSSRRTGRRTSRGSTSCGRCAASTRAYRAACTCTSARAVSRRCCTRRRGCADGGRPRARRSNGSRSLIARLDSIDDVEARELAEELIGTMLELYGEGLGRIVDALEAAPEVRDALARDGVVASLLLIHGLYPVPLGERVEAALESVRPYMESHGGGVELVRLEDGVAHLRLHGSCDGCPASASTLELAIREALDEAAPDLDGIEVEGVVEPGRATPVPRPGTSAPAPEAGVQARWMELVGVRGLGAGEMTEARVGVVPLLVANVGGTLLAYRNACAGCGAPLHRAELDGGLLTCAGCGRRFELPLAGRAVGEDLQLAPVPLLEDDGRVRVAVS